MYRGVHDCSKIILGLQVTTGSVLPNVTEISVDVHDKSECRHFKSWHFTQVTTCVT